MKSNKTTGPTGLDRRALLGVAGAAVAAAGAAPAASQAAAASPAAPLADTVYGRIRGLNRGPVKVFLGVPYGADTGGANRWLPPKPPAKWAGVRDCTDYGDAPPQNEPNGAPMREETQMMQQSPMSEDCLRINVYTPAVGPTSGKRAVMVWFHGGGFSAGSGNAWPYDGSNLARKHDVVVVSVTHRLNHFGFLYLGELFGDAYADSGVVGMLDCIAALQWIRDNIKNFGGDPGRVMLFGQSGGGGKVSTLMGMPAAKGLFHRVAAMSGAAVRSGVKAQAAANAKRLVDALGAKSLAELQSIPFERIVTTARANPGSGGSGPIVDGKNLPANVFDPEASPLSRDIPLISSTTETETASWGAPTDPLTDAQALAAVKQSTRLSDADAAALLGVFRENYPGKDNMYLVQLLTTQWGFSANVLDQAERKAKQSAAGGAPVYFLQFAKHMTVRGGRLHSPHTCDIGFCWDTLAQCWPIIGKVTPDKQKVADIMSGYWTNFAKTGNPNGPGLPKWDAFNLDTRPMLQVSDNTKMINDIWGPTRKAVAEYKTKVPPPAPAAPPPPRAG